MGSTAGPRRVVPAALRRLLLLPRHAKGGARPQRLLLPLLLVCGGCHWRLELWGGGQRARGAGRDGATGGVQRAPALGQRRAADCSPHSADCRAPGSHSSGGRPLPPRARTTDSLPPGCAAAWALKCSSLSALIAFVSSSASLCAALSAARLGAFCSAPAGGRRGWGRRWVGPALRRRRPPPPPHVRPRMHCGGRRAPFFVFCFCSLTRLADWALVLGLLAAPLLALSGFWAMTLLGRALQVLPSWRMCSLCSLQACVGRPASR